MAVSTLSVGIADNTSTKQSFATMQDPAALNRSIVSLDEAGVGLYRCAASFVPFGTADRTLISVTGSATKTVRIRKILMSGTVATTAASAAFQVTRTTALGTGGTAVAPALAKVDSGTVGAGTAVVNHYTTAAQSLGTGPITLTKFNFFAQILNAPGATSPAVGGPIFQQVWPDGLAVAQQSLVLRGATDFIEIGNTASNSPATLIYYVIEFSEDAS